MQPVPHLQINANWGPRDPDSEVNIRGWVVTFIAHDLNVHLGTLEADADPLRQLKITPPYINSSTAMWKQV